jgi:DNA gyrase subunit A
MIMTRSGQMIRMPVKGISVMGRNTQGVRLVNLAPGAGTGQPEGELLPDVVAGVTRVVSEEEDGEGAAGNGDAPEPIPGLDEPTPEA